MSGAQEVADLLRSRRERLQPADVGLPPGVRRRARGLRREEVAQLASVSPTYYTFLEQGRDIRPSRQVLDALAGALRMSEAERAYLHELVHGEPAVPGAGPQQVPGALLRLVERLDPHPAYVKGRRWDVLAANRAARALWADWPSLPERDRNLLCWTFLDPASRSVLVGWEEEAAAQLARFRNAAARHPDDPAFTGLFERLHAGSAEVREWWPRHDVAPLSSGTKRIRHPELGVLTMQHVLLQLADDPELKLVTYSADPADADRIAGLLARRPSLPWPGEQR